MYIYSIISIHNIARYPNSLQMIIVFLHLIGIFLINDSNHDVQLPALRVLLPDLQHSMELLTNPQPVLVLQADGGLLPVCWTPGTGAESYLNIIRFSNSNNNNFKKNNTLDVIFNP